MSNLNRMIEMDHEVGKTNSPPKLIRIEEYHFWKERFESFVRYNDVSMWFCIENEYVQPTKLVEGITKVAPFTLMNADEKKMYEAENRVRSCIQMCLPQEILHLTKKYKTAKALWDALEQKYSGSAKVKKSRGELLKKQFAIFKHTKGETLDQTITRFYHLLTELDSHKIAYEDEEIKDKFLDALP